MASTGRSLQIGVMGIAPNYSNDALGYCSETAQWQPEQVTEYLQDCVFLHPHNKTKQAALYNHYENKISATKELATRQCDGSLGVCLVPQQ